MTNIYSSRTAQKNQSSLHPKNTQAHENVKDTWSQ